MQKLNLNYLQEVIDVVLQARPNYVYKSRFRVQNNTATKEIKYVG